ncbi:peptidoglycan DD-metalloendopeptidase family protein [Saccharothrix isguenensis]
MTISRLSPILALAVAVATTVIPTPNADARPDSPTLATVVGEAARARAATEPAATTWTGTKVTVLRSEDDRWTFGSVVLVAPRQDDARPRDWLFLAEKHGGRWRVGLDGQAAFAELAASSRVVTDEERAVFAAHGSTPSTTVAGDYRTGMQLPWAVGQSWSMLGGPHAHDAGSGPWSSLDLAGGDQRVLAARAGLAYTTCVGLVRVLHPDGYASRYYHLWNHVQADGLSVAAGTFLGYTGTETGCGGVARARHVHFSLMHNGSFTAIAHHIIGKWVLRNGSAQYGGSALHGSTRVDVGGALHNYGALGRTQGLVDANGGTVVNRRSGPGSNYPVAGTAADGSTVDVRCSSNGTTHTGRWGTTALWNRMSDGTWISDAFTYTGIDGPVNGYC